MPLRYLAAKGSLLARGRLALRREVEPLRAFRFPALRQSPEPQPEQRGIDLRGVEVDAEPVVEAQLTQKRSAVQHTSPASRPSTWLRMRSWPMRPVVKRADRAMRPVIALTAWKLRNKKATPTGRNTNPSCTVSILHAPHSCGAPAQASKGARTGCRISQTEPATKETARQNAVTATGKRTTATSRLSHDSPSLSTDHIPRQKPRPGAGVTLVRGISYPVRPSMSALSSLTSDRQAMRPPARSRQADEGPREAESDRYEGDRENEGERRQRELDGEVQEIPPGLRVPDDAEEPGWVHRATGNTGHA